MNVALQYANENGVVMVAAAGNNGGNVSLLFPASSAKTLGDLIAVGSSDYTTSTVITQSPFSDMANSNVPYSYVNAPGANVLGYSYPSLGSALRIGWGSGTSYAAPIVAAEIAILEEALLDAYPRLGQDQTELAAASVYCVTVGLVGVTSNPAPNASGSSPSVYFS